MKPSRIPSERAKAVTDFLTQLGGKEISTGKGADGKLRMWHVRGQFLILHEYTCGGITIYGQIASTVEGPEHVFVMLRTQLKIQEAY